nr:hypothetical protein [Tautonia rosea]
MIGTRKESTASSVAGEQETCDRQIGVERVEKFSQIFLGRFGIPHMKPNGLTNTHQLGSDQSSARVDPQDASDQKIPSLKGILISTHDTPQVETCSNPLQITWWYRLKHFLKDVHRWSSTKF